MKIALILIISFLILSLAIPTVSASAFSGHATINLPKITFSGSFPKSTIRANANINFKPITTNFPKSTGSIGKFNVNVKPINFQPAYKSSDAKFGGNIKFSSAKPAFKNTNLGNIAGNVKWTMPKYQPVRWNSNVNFNTKIFGRSRITPTKVNIPSQKSFKSVSTGKLKVTVRQQTTTFVDP
ncbi:hypothetical protein ACFLQN_00420 [Candidatus Aenigmatarchaeota archaeon]